MPKLCTTSGKPLSIHTAHSINLALAKMGDGLGRPFTNGTGGNRFAIVAIEYFTRWIEAKPLATITSETIKKFF